MPSTSSGTKLSTYTHYTSKIRPRLARAPSWIPTHIIPARFALDWLGHQVEYLHTLYQQDSPSTGSGTKLSTYTHYTSKIRPRLARAPSWIPTHIIPARFALDWLGHQVGYLHTLYQQDSPSTSTGTKLDTYSHYTSKICPRQARAPSWVPTHILYPKIRPRQAWAPSWIPHTLYQQDSPSTSSGTGICLHYITFIKHTPSTS